jgi:aminotransferase
MQIHPSKFQMADRIKKIRASGMRQMFSVAKGLSNTISLGLGEPDFSPPPHVLAAEKQALDNGKTHYAPTAGIPELLEALAQKAKLDYGLSYDPNEEIMVTVGGTEAIFLALLALINPGEKVLVPDPGFVCYEPSVNLVGGTVVSVPVLEHDGFKVRKGSVISQITDDLKIIIINTPSNPTGSVLSHDDLSELSKVFNERDVIVISDEVYEKITYGSATHCCLAAFPGMRERTIVIGSFSKTYAMTGFRVGYAYGPKSLLAPMMLAHQFNVACVDGSAQYGALAALKGPQDFIKRMVTEFDRRRNLVYSRLREMEGIICTLPEGAFYVFPNIRSFEVSSEEFAGYLEKKADVITIPGSAFGDHGEGYLRLSYAAAYDELEEALFRIEKAAREFRKA